MNILYFLMLATFWGGSFIAIQNTLLALPSYLGAFIRVFLALLMLITIFKSLGKPLSIPKEKRLLSWIGGLFAIGFPFAFLFWGEQFVSPALAAILNGTVPILTFVLAMIFTRQDEPFTVSKLLGVVFGLFGVLVIFEPKLAQSGHINEVWGAVSVLMMSICYAIGVLINRRILKDGLSFQANIVHQHFSSAVFLGLLSLCFTHLPNLQDVLQTKVVLSLLYLSFFSSTLAFMLFFYLIKTIGSVRASMVTYLAPAMAILLDGKINHHWLQSYEIGGACLILIGVLISQNKFSFLFTRNNLKTSIAS